MNIQSEIELKSKLKQMGIREAKLRNEAKELIVKAEDIVAEACKIAYDRGASVVFIADALNINRQRVYLLLAMKGIRPGKGVANVNDAA